MQHQESNGDKAYSKVFYLRSINPFVDLVGSSQEVGGFDRAELSLHGFFSNFKIYPDFVHFIIYRPGRRACNKDSITLVQISVLELDLCNTQFPEVIGDFAYIKLPFRRIRAIGGIPFPQLLSEIISVPESPVKHPCQSFHPGVRLFPEYTPSSSAITASL